MILRHGREEWMDFVFSVGPRPPPSSHSIVSGLVHCRTSGRWSEETMGMQLEGEERRRRCGEQDGGEEERRETREERDKEWRGGEIRDEQ